MNSDVAAREVAREQEYVDTVYSQLEKAALSAQDIGCDPGDVEVERVRFEGNTTFTDAQLANGLVTTPSSWARRVFRVIGTRRCLDPQGCAIRPRI